MIAESFVGWLQSVGRGIRPWATVRPWEQGVRIRLGKHTRLLLPGVHSKVPMVDTVSIYPIRTRTTPAPLQTLRTVDNRTVTVGLAIQYRISDLLVVLQTLHNPEMTLIHMAQGAVSELVATLTAEQISPDRISRAVIDTIAPARFGIDELSVLVTDNADLTQRTIRLLQGDRWCSDRTIEDLGTHE